MADKAVNSDGVRMPVNRSFERELSVLEAMAGRAPDPEDIGRLRKALAHENNYLVAKAAHVVAEHRIDHLMAEVLAAYDRFFLDPIKTDPQCWAKNALAKTLVELECDNPEVYLRGLRHTQDEPVWGGQSDTAGGLRATCTQAIIRCDSLTEAALLHILLEPLLDPDKSVRLEAVRAFGEIGGIGAGLVLKLRALLRKEEPEVMGACFTALLAMDHGGGGGTIDLVAGFLDDGEEAAAEAAFALAESHEPKALKLLLERRRRGASAWFGSVLDQAIALTRMKDGTDFLLGVIEKNPRLAPSALEALSRVHESPEMRARVAAAVEAANSEHVHTAFLQFFPEEKPAS